MSYYITDMNQVNSGLKILICDDMPDVIDCMVFCINQVSPPVQNIKRINNGIEAIEILKKEFFDILICDIDNIDIGGFKVFESVEETMNPKIKKMIVSAHKGQEHIEKAIELKVKSYVLKPFDNPSFERNYLKLFK